MTTTHDDVLADEAMERAREAAAETALPLLTSSRLRCFRTCARLHQYTYIEGWRPAKEPEYFRVGSLVHTGLECWWKAVANNHALPGRPCGIDGCGGTTEASGLCGICDWHGGDVADPLDWALSAVQGLCFDPYEQVRVEEMLRGYHLRWFGEADRYDVLAVELTFDAPLLNPKTRAASKTWRLAGKIDAIVRRREDGHVLVVEHKTCGESIDDESDHYWGTLALDHQCSAYVIGAEAHGYKVDEILYDVLRKPAQRQLLATPEADRKYTKPTKTEPARLYSNQRERDETVEEHRARVRETMDAAPERFFQRRPVPRTESQIADFLADAWAFGRTMREMEIAERAPRNPEACHRFGTCGMWGVCSTGTHPSDHPEQFKQVENVNQELAR